MYLSLLKRPAKAQVLLGKLLPMIALLTLLLAQASVALDLSADSPDLLDIHALESSVNLYHAGAAPTAPPQNPETFIQSLKPASTIDRVSGGAYWLSVELDNPSDINDWVFSTNNSLVDSIHSFLYRESGEIDTGVSGYLEPLKYDLHYGIDLHLEQEESAHLLVFIDSRYFSGAPRLQIISNTDYLSVLGFENTWIIGCLGAMLILMLYNLFIATSMRDLSYFYYALYLASTVVAWAGAMNLLTSWFDLKSYFWIIPFFFYTIAFNMLYIIYFMELRSSNPRLFIASCVFTGFTLFMALFGSTLFQTGVFQQIQTLSATTWVFLGLACGIVRLRQDYKPARYFVAAFALLAIGMVFSIATAMGAKPLFENTFLVTLIAQTFDVLLLSLALADRINLLRAEKQSASEMLYEIEKARLSLEKEAREALAAANDTLLEALEISKKESENKSNFLRMVSHELRTPLHSISSAFRQLNEHEDKDTQKEILNDINYGTLRLRTQIDNLVLMAETDSDELTAQSFPFEIAHLLNRLCERTEEQLQDKDVNLVHNRSQFLPHGFQGDSYLISHLLRTVLDNACKFTEHGDIIFGVDWNEESQCLEVLIIDDGCGMSEEQQKVVFDGFIQVSQGLARQSEGLGLGLTLCHRLGDILDATLSIDSTVGDGTEINLHIPLKKLISEAISVSHTDYRGAVLIVEDNLVNAKVLERMVIQMGHPVDVAHSGLEALAAVDKRAYAVILMDVQMPDMDGISATTKIRERKISTPIIAVTANSDSNVRRDCRHAGMNDFLVKPVSATDVQLALATWQQMTSAAPTQGNLH